MAADGEDPPWEPLRALRDQKQYFTLSIQYYMNRELEPVCVSKAWNDHYLQWNKSEHPGVQNLRFTTDQVWTPDILLYNR